jgi:hypothetical protein
LIPVRRESVRRVLDHFEAAPSGEFGYRLDVTWPAAKMDRRDRLALWRPFPIGIIKVNSERDGIDVDEYDVGAKVMKCGGSRREREGRHQHPVAKPYAAGFSSQVNPCGGRIDCHGLDPASEKISEPLFEFAAFASSCEPPGLKDSDRGLNLPIADRGLKKRDAHAQPLSHAAIDPHRRACCSAA